MVHYWSLDDVRLNNSWLTIGSFDGVHLGHQEIVGNLTSGAHAAGAPAVVLTFYPHPSIVLGKRNGSFYLTSPEDKASLLTHLGVDVVITHPFNREVAAMTAAEFMNRLNEHLGLKRLCVGYDFALGRGREGDVPTLRRLGKELGYTLEVFPPVKVDDQVVSSSRIREMLTLGEVAQAARLLGRPYSVKGEVTRGDGRGRTIGIPTANLAVWEELILPAAGVYVGQAVVSGQTFGAVTNIGIRPTFSSNSSSPHIEAHILDFDGDLYSRQIELTFLQRVRSEMRFPNAQALVEQIHQDIALARQILSIKK